MGNNCVWQADAAGGGDDGPVKTDEQIKAVKFKSGVFGVYISCPTYDAVASSHAPLLHPIS